MASQNAAIGVAIAGYFPTLTLSGAAGYVGDPFIAQIAGANPMWSVAAGLAQPLFNGGLTDAQVAAARAAYDSAVATYRQTTLTAFQQVEDQLVAIRVYGDRSRPSSWRSRRPNRRCRSRSTSIRRAPRLHHRHYRARPSRSPTSRR